MARCKLLQGVQDTFKEIACRHGVQIACPPQRHCPSRANKNQDDSWTQPLVVIATGFHQWQSNFEKQKHIDIIIHIHICHIHIHQKHICWSTSWLPPSITKVPPAFHQNHGHLFGHTPFDACHRILPRFLLGEVSDSLGPRPHLEAFGPWSYPLVMSK